MIAKQGHRYDFQGRAVMAMETSEYPVVHVIDHSMPWPLRYLGRVNASKLTPLPMVYFNGEVPK